MNSLKSHLIIPISTHPRMLLHGRYPTEIPPASSHALVVIPHPPPSTLAHSPPFSSHSICSDVGKIKSKTRINDKVIAKIIKNSLGNFNLKPYTKSVYKINLFIFEGNC